MKVKFINDGIFDEFSAEFESLGGDYDIQGFIFSNGEVTLFIDDKEYGDGSFKGIIKYIKEEINKYTKIHKELLKLDIAKIRAELNKKNKNLETS